MLSQAPNSNKPQTIQWAITCLWVSAALVALLMLVSWTAALGIPGGVEPMLTNLIGLLLFVFVAMKLNAGRNWARWLYAGVYVFGSLMFLVSLLLAPQVFLSFPMVLQGSAVVQFALQTATLVLLFISTSSQWFRSEGFAK